MRTIKIFLLSFSLFIALPAVFAQSNEVPSRIITALSAGDADELSEFLNKNVELVIDTKNNVFSRQQACNIINDFFRKNKINGFQLLHKGNKDAACFAIGTLRTSNGSFRVYILTRKNEIQQLRIEPTNE